MIRKYLSHPWLQLLTIVILLLLLGSSLGSFIPAAIDWHTVFRPATIAALAGKSPYSITGFYYPPWTILFLAPMAIFPEPVGRGILAVATMTAYAFITLRMGGKKLAVILLLLSPPVLHCVLNGNVDWLTALGFVLPPQLGLFFLLIKPQMGGVVALFYLGETWRNHGFRGVVKVFGPVAIALLLSFGIFGLWPFRYREVLNFSWNASLWPASIPVGLGLLVAAFRRRKVNFAIVAAPCLSPYVLLHSWVGGLLAICASLPELVAAFVGMWILILLRS